jgi:hypothetical protein
LIPGQRVTVRHGDLAVATATIESIEIHSAPGMTTVAIDELCAGVVRAGSVLTAS